MVIFFQNTSWSLALIISQINHQDSSYIKEANYKCIYKGDA